jgi:hypothetical protein
MGLKQKPRVLNLLKLKRSYSIVLTWILDRILCCTYIHPRSNNNEIALWEVRSREAETVFYGEIESCHPKVDS